MKLIPFLALVLLIAAAGCGYGGGSADGGNDGKTLDAADGSNGVIECTPGQSRCPVGEDCQCCGSIGPSPICLCSNTCNSDQDCLFPDQPECNKPGPDSAGICTPTGYNCCWFCQ